MIFCEAYFCSWYRFTITIALKIFVKRGPVFEMFYDDMNSVNNYQIKASLTVCAHCQVMSYDGKYNTNIKYKYT